MASDAELADALNQWMREARKSRREDRIEWLGQLIEEYVEDAGIANDPMDDGDEGAALQRLDHTQKKIGRVIRGEPVNG